MRETKWQSRQREQHVSASKQARSCRGLGGRGTERRQFKQRTSPGGDELRDAAKVKIM